MKKSLLLVAVAMLFGGFVGAEPFAAAKATPSPTPTPAPNLITNGDFETGDLTGWTASDGVSITTDSALSGTYSALLGQNQDTSPGTLSQTITTTAGKSYFIKLLTGGSYSISGTVTGSNSSVLYTINSWSSAGMFTADSASTTLSFTTSPWDNDSLDNVQVKALSFSKPGKYTGSRTTVYSFEGIKDVTSTDKQSVVARIDAAGRLVGITTYGNTISAIIQDNEIIATSSDSDTSMTASNVNLKAGTISFTTSYSWDDDLTGVKAAEKTTVSLKYAGK